MPIVVTCTSCDKKLRVPDDLLGKKVKCPGCGTIFVGKVGDDDQEKDKPSKSVRPKPRAPSREDSDDDEQSEETSGGVQSRPSQKGSRPRDDDDEDPPERPSRAGKKNKDDDDDDDDEDERPSKRRGRKDDDDDDDRPSRRRRGSDDDDDRPSRRSRRRSLRGRNYQPHRGVLILVLGIASIVTGLVICCSLVGIPGGLGCGIPAWILGNIDRRKMAAGQMDPAGHGMTTAGWICGIIGTCLGALHVFCFLLNIVLRLAGVAGAGAFDNNNFGR